MLHGVNRRFCVIMYENNVEMFQVLCGLCSSTSCDALHTYTPLLIFWQCSIQLWCTVASVRKRLHAYRVTLTFSWKIISLSLLMCGFHTQPLAS